MTLEQANEILLVYKAEAVAYRIGICILVVESLWREACE